MKHRSPKNKKQCAEKNESFNTKEAFNRKASTIITKGAVGGAWLFRGENWKP